MGRSHTDGEDVHSLTVTVSWRRRITKEVKQENQKAAYRRHSFPKAQRTFCANHLQEHSQHPNTPGPEGDKRDRKRKQLLDQTVTVEFPPKTV